MRQELFDSRQRKPSVRQDPVEILGDGLLGENWKIARPAAIDVERPLLDDRAVKRRPVVDQPSRACGIWRACSASSCSRDRRSTRARSQIAFNQATGSQRRHRHECTPFLRRRGNLRAKNSGLFVSRSAPPLSSKRPSLAHRIKPNIQIKTSSAVLNRAFIVRQNGDVPRALDRGKRSRPLRAPDQSSIRKWEPRTPS